MKLALGTVQFGLSYGISNTVGKVSEIEATKILSSLQAHNVDLLDTAQAYGSSEVVLGNFFSEYSSDNLRIVTKTLPLRLPRITTKDVDSVKLALSQSLKKLHKKSVYACLVHHSGDIMVPGGDALFQELHIWKALGLLQKVGVSVYSPEELETVFELYGSHAPIPFDCIQIPSNVLDQRFLGTRLLNDLRKKGVEIHVRSAFLQGLLLMDLEKIPDYFLSIHAHLLAYRSFLNKHTLAPIDAALGYLEQSKEVDYVIAGVSSYEEFRQITDTFNKLKFLPQLDYKEFAIQDERILNPSLWKP